MASSHRGAFGGDGKLALDQRKLSRPMLLRQRVEACERSIVELNKAIRATVKSATDSSKKNRALVEVMKRVAANEYSTQLKTVFENTAEAIKELEDIRENVVWSRFGTTIVPTLTAYSKQTFAPCKAMVTDLEKAFINHGKLVEKYQTLQVKEKSGESPKMVAAEQELLDGRVKAENTDAKFMHLAQLMERKRVGDLKRVMTEVINANLHFHCKGIERFTALAEMLAKVEADAEARQLVASLEGSPAGALPTTARAGEHM